MKKAGQLFKHIFKFIYNYFPIIGGYSIRDADELIKDPDNYDYRGMSWFKRQVDKWRNKK